MFYCVVYYGPFLCIVSFRWYMFCLLVVLVKFQYLPSDWLERLLWESLTVARELSPKSPDQRVGMIFLVYSIVSLFNCIVVLFPALRDTHYTSVAWYSRFVVKLPLNNNTPTKPNLGITRLWIQLLAAALMVGPWASCSHDSLTILVGWLEEHRHFKNLSTPTPKGSLENLWGIQHNLG